MPRPFLADVDFFKLYNDTYGHQAGDGCLKKIAQLLRTSINRAGDLAARYGGEEFIIVLSNTDTNGAAHISESIREGVKDLKIVHETSSVANYVTISLGCSTLYPQKGEDHTSLVKLADEALYMSKQKGRNQTTVINL